MCENILYKQNDRNLFLTIILWKILNETYSKNIFHQTISKGIFFHGNFNGRIFAKFFMEIFIHKISVKQKLKPINNSVSGNQSKENNDKFQFCENCAENSSVQHGEIFESGENFFLSELK